MKRLILSTAVLAVSAPAFAQGRACGPTHVVFERLASTYGEAIKSVGLTRSGATVMVLANDETGSWSVTVTNSSETCLIASGQGFTAINEVVEQGDPT